MLLWWLLAQLRVQLSGSHRKRSALNSETGLDHKTTTLRISNKFVQSRSSCPVSHGVSVKLQDTTLKYSHCLQWLGAHLFSSIFSSNLMVTRNKMMILTLMGITFQHSPQSPPQAQRQTRVMIFTLSQCILLMRAFWSQWRVTEKYVCFRLKNSKK